MPSPILGQSEDGHSPDHPRRARRTRRSEANRSSPLGGGGAIASTRKSVGQVVAAGGIILSALVGVTTNLAFAWHGWKLSAAIGSLIVVTLAAAALAVFGVNGQSASTDSNAVAAIRLTGPKAEAFAQFIGDVASTGGPRSTGAENGYAVDREKERADLKKFLAAKRSGVVLVQGRPGVGKTTLVKSVIDELDDADAPCLHPLAPGTRFDVKMLLDDIELNAPISAEEDALSRLEAVMEKTDGPLRIIVIDSAQSLLDPDMDTVVNKELNEALEVIVRGERPRVKVVLVVCELPALGAGTGWRAKALEINVRGLPHKDFNTFVSGLDHIDHRLAAALVKQPDLLWDAVQGNPGLAIVFCSVIALSHGSRSAPALAASLADRSAEERGLLLVAELVRFLTGQQRSIVTALIAYGTPVDAEQVRNLVNDVQPGRVAPILVKLERDKVIREADPGHYYLAAPSILKALTQSLNVSDDLLRDAADLLSHHCRRPEEMEEPEDLYLHFAVLDIRVRAGQWDSAYRLIGTIDDLLARWNGEVLLLKYREAITGKLETDYQEMQNRNALGNLYLSRGRFPEARESYEKALSHAERAMSTMGRQKIYNNLAALEWARGSVAKAETYYRDALASAELNQNVLDSPLDRVKAMTGLADCHRRRGDYAAAIRDGMTALSLAQVEKSPLAANIAVKLTRWHSELNDRDEADRLLGVVQEAVAEHHEENPMLKVRWMDAHAELLLDTDELRDAEKVAKEALKEALDLQDPVTVLRTRSTMAMAHLRGNHTKLAKREIERAAAYRREGRSLVVLALQALIAFKADSGGPDAAEHFEQLRREAYERRSNDERDFEAWEFEGLAICGLRGGRPDESLDAAVEAFRRARRQVPVMPPILANRMREWFDILQARAAPGRFHPVLDVAVGVAEISPM